MCLLTLYVDKKKSGDQEIEFHEIEIGGQNY